MNNTIITNFTNFVTNRDNFSFNNPVCDKELNALAKYCSDFKVEVINTINTRFKTGLIISFILYSFIIYVHLKQPKFSQTEFYKNQIEFRLYFFTWVIFLITLGLMFV
jgi:hypothetical protein